MFHFSASQAKPECSPELVVLCNINNNIAGGVDHKHQVVPPGEVVSPARPVLDSPVLQHLNSFINIEAKSGGMTEEKDDDNGEEEGNHGGVSPVVVGDGIVQGGSFSNCGIYEIVKNCNYSHRKKIHHKKVSKHNIVERINWVPS